VTAGPAATLLRLLAVPLLVSAAMVGVWLMGDSPAARVANVELLWKFAGPLLASGVAIRLARSGTERALVFPTPLLLWLIFPAQRAPTVPLLAVLLASCAVLVLLHACWQVKRGLAQWAAACCGAATIWMNLGSGG
jgi:hypothetical protein